MNLEEVIQTAKKAINKKYTLEDCVQIMAPLGINKYVISSIVELICDQPERTSLEARKGSDVPNSENK